MIFTPEKAEQWLAEHMYPEAGIEPDTMDIAKLRKAMELLDYPVGGNAAFRRFLTEQVYPSELVKEIT